VREPFVVPIVELVRHRGTRREVTLVGPLRGVELSTARLVPDEVRADLTLEAQGSVVTVTGAATGEWTGECRRCLEAAGGSVTVELREVFEPHPVEGETYALGGDQIDLSPALREAFALALPLAPLCDEACPGPDPDAHPVTPEADEARGGASSAGVSGPGRAEEGGDEPPGGRRVGDPRWAALDALRFDR
jgi:uncharacterized protein